MTAPQLAPGTVVAQKYRIGACLGHAGSAATYQAAAGDGREVVLKIFDPAIRQRSDIMAAIEQTYAATNALPQDVAVPLLDAGYDAGTGAPFSVGERIPFPSLAALAAQRPLSPEEVANVLAVMAQLLDRAHQRQLFHHALKPTNVFVGFAQGYGVRVTDFGAGLPRTAVPTQEGYALAAPWLAPEQAQAAAPAGAAADVFAAALVAFYALTGRSYWRSCQGELNLAGWQQELLGGRTPPSARARELGVQLNAAFDGVLGCALSVDPNQRYRTLGELAQAFEGVVVSKPPESQATMAFPQGAGAPGGYPPAPAAPAMPAAPRPMAAPTLVTAQGPYGVPQPAPSQPQMAAPAAPVAPQPMEQAGYPGAGPYVSTPPAAAPAGPNGGLGETSAGRPVDPAIFQRRPPASKVAPVVVGIVTLLLLAGAAVAFIVLSRKPPAPPIVATAPTETASASAPPVEPPVESAKPAESAAPVASAEPDAGPGGPESTLACEPADCDEIKVDDKPIDVGKPVVLTAGKHVVVATKAGYVTAKETITVAEGEKVDKVFKLKEKSNAPPPTPINTPSKPCGKFLKRCK